MKRKITSWLLALLMAASLICGITEPAFAAQDLIYTTNGAANRYSAGSVLVIYGKVTEDGIAKSNLAVTIDIKDSSDRVIYYGQVKTDSLGYFNTNFTVPYGVSGSMNVKISTNEGEKVNASYTLSSSPGTLIVQGSRPAVSRTESEAQEIPVDTSEIAVVFDSNVNYFNNRNSNLGTATLGLNTKNEDCFTLYKKTNSGYEVVGSSVNLTIDTTGIVSGLTYFPEIAEADRKDQARDVIFISPSNGFESGTTYKLVIDRELAANSSITIGSDVALYFKTKAAHTTGSSGSGPSLPAPAYPDKNVSVESTTTVTGTSASTSVAEKALLTAVTNAVKDAGENDTAAVIEISVDAEKDVKSMDVTIPYTGAENIVSSGINTVISTPVASLTFDSKAMDTLVTANKNQDIKISINKLEAESLPDNLQNIIGDNPVFEFSASAGNVNIPNFNGGKVGVSIPYLLPEGKDINSLVIYYINDKGEMQVVKECKYDPAKKTISFVTDHFSKYSVGSNAVVFDDVVENAWYKSTVDFVAARELFGSVSATERLFNGDGFMTRAMFATVIARLDGVDLTTYKTSGFTDVAVDEWYGRSVAWAAAKGIVSGTGGGRFDPDSNITREQMAVMMTNYIKYKGIALPGSAKPAFADADSVSSWAKDSVNAMQTYGLISGVGNNEFAPANTATRAEVATIFANFIKTMVH